MSLMVFCSFCSPNSVTKYNPLDKCDKLTCFMPSEVLAFRLKTDFPETSIIFSSSILTVELMFTISLKGFGKIEVFLKMLRQHLKFQH